jgi:murein DD-endopeptidase MepM/ murein hydrolase activator NlpD
MYLGSATDGNSPIKTKPRGVQAMHKKNFWRFSLLLVLLLPERPAFALDWSQIEWDDKPLVTIKLHGVPRNIAASSTKNQETRQTAVSSNDMDVKSPDAKAAISGSDGIQINVSSVDIAIMPPPVKPQPSNVAPPGTSAAKFMSEPGEMKWPVNGKVSSRFGKRGNRRHEGIDIPAAKGSFVLATQDGIVADV